MASIRNSGVFVLALSACGCGGNDSFTTASDGGSGASGGTSAGGASAGGASAGGTSAGGTSAGGASAGGASAGGASAGGSSAGGTSAGGTSAGGTSGSGGSPVGGGGGTGPEPGELDPSFGQGGSLLGDVAPGFASWYDVHDVAIQSDGRVILAGTKAGATYRDFLFARFSADGKLEVTKTDDIGNHFDDANAVTVMSDGSIVLAGTANDGFFDRFGLIRYQSNGAIDTGFDGDGKVMAGVGSNDRAWDVVGVGDDVIAVGETVNLLGYSDFCVIRYTNAGKPKASFDYDGIVSVDLGGKDVARAVMVQSDGRVVVSGEVGSNAIGVVRLNADGSLDQTFGTGGKKTILMSANVSVRAVASAADGKIVIGAELDNDFLVVQLTSAGALDTAFSTDGRATFDHSSDDSPRALLVDTQGKVVLAGSAIANGGGIQRMALLRFSSNGSADYGFGAGGLAIHGTDAGDERAFAARELSDGYLVAGEKTTSSGMRVFIQKIAR